MEPHGVNNYYYSYKQLPNCCCSLVASAQFNLANIIQLYKFSKEWGNRMVLYDWTMWLNIYVCLGKVVSFRGFWPPETPERHNLTNGPTLNNTIYWGAGFCWRLDFFVFSHMSGWYWGFFLIWNKSISVFTSASYRQIFSICLLLWSLQAYRLCWHWWHLKKMFRIRIRILLLSLHSAQHPSIHTT